MNEITKPEDQSREAAGRLEVQGRDRIIGLGVGRASGNKGQDVIFSNIKTRRVSGPLLPKAATNQLPHPSTPPHLPLYSDPRLILVLKKAMVMAKEEILMCLTFCPGSPGNPDGPCNFQQRTYVSQQTTSSIPPLLGISRFDLLIEKIIVSPYKYLP